VGLVGIVIAFIGITGMFAFQQAPFYDSDEKAHLGYAHEIADFRLPEIERQPEVPDSATQWQVERGTGRDSRYRAVWVANHPPLHYIAVAPLTWFAEATDRPDGGLLLMRFANIAFAAAGVVFTYLLATELAGKRRVGLAAAAIVALVPQGHTYFSRALNDGLAFAACTGLLWAGVRCLRRPDRRNLLVLGATAAVAAGTRTATMLLAVVVVAAVALDQLTRVGSDPWRPRMRRAATVVAIGLGPAVALFGWFYVRIQLLYGDVGASTFLLEHFDREPRGSIPFVLTQGRLWVHLFHRMASTAPLSWAWPRFANIVGLVAIAGLVVALVRPRAGTSRRAIAVCVVAVAIITLTVAQHLAGGGSPYPRYFFPVLGVLAALAAVGLDRLLPRLLPAAVVIAMAWWAVKQLPIGVDPVFTRRPRDNGAVPPPALRVLPVGDGWRMIAAGTIVTGAVVIVTALCLGLARWRRPTVP
jgi:Dolichyl-phosphate-mannose-protein mannosyltransferase